MSTTPDPPFGEPLSPLPTIRFELDPLGPLPAGYSQVGEDEWRTEPMTLLEAVIATAGERLVEHAKKDGSRDVYKTLVERIRNIRDEEIRAAIRPVIDRTLIEPLQPTNTLGENTGPETTLRELIMAEVNKQLSVRSSGSGSRRSDQTVLESVVADEVGAALGKELREALDEAKAEVLAAVREKGNEVLTEALARALPRT